MDIGTYTHDTYTAIYDQILSCARQKYRHGSQALSSSYYNMVIFFFSLWN